MNTQAVGLPTLKILKSIFLDPAFEQFYLVGGTGLALQLGHRRSQDIDLFSNQPFAPTLLTLLGNHGELTVLSAQPNSIEAILNETKVFLMHFAYPLYRPLKEEKGVRMADAVDIGLMKLLSLSGRDSQKDIIDLYFIDQEVMGLEELLQVFDSFYPTRLVNGYDALKSFFNESRLSQQPPLQMLKRVNWEEAYQRVSSAVLAFLHQKLSDAFG